jgi:hypothetical protein
MRLSEIKGDAALDALADLIEPAAEIMSDPQVKQLYDQGKSARAVAVAIKNHKDAVKTVLAVMDGEDPEKYNPSLLSLPLKLIELLNDPEVISLFRSPRQSSDDLSFGGATANTEGDRQ